MKKSLFIVSVLVGVMGCTTPLIAKDGGKQGDKAQYETTLSAAKEARKKASAAGGEWRDIGKFLKQAGAAAEKGDYAKAGKLAKKALQHSELGHAQAIAEKDADFPAYMK